MNTTRTRQVHVLGADGKSRYHPGTRVHFDKDYPGLLMVIDDDTFVIAYAPGHWVWAELVRLTA